MGEYGETLAPRSPSREFNTPFRADHQDGTHAYDRAQQKANPEASQLHRASFRWISHRLRSHRVLYRVLMARWPIAATLNLVGPGILGRPRRAWLRSDTGGAIVAFLLMAPPVHISGILCGREMEMIGLSSPNRHSRKQKKKLAIRFASRPYNTVYLAWLPYLRRIAKLRTRRLRVVFRNSPRLNYGRSQCDADRLISATISARLNSYVGNLASGRHRGVNQCAFLHLITSLGCVRGIAPSRPIVEPFGGFAQSDARSRSSRPAEDGRGR